MQAKIGHLLGGPNRVRSIILKHTCEFCQVEFKARPQVKNPRACHKLKCQRRRQRLNEKTWREKSGLTSDPKYHQIRRLQRRRLIEEIVREIVKCLEIGGRFFGRRFDAHGFSAILSKFIFELGLRRANKFCDFRITINSQSLSP